MPPFSGMRQAYDPGAQIRGVLVQKMAPRGEEVILGMNRYPVFGPLIMFGTGGIFVEVFQDVIFRLAPIRRNSARAMIRGIKGYKLLQGFRGRPRVDLAVLEKLLVSFSDLVCRHPEIQEIDVNPLLLACGRAGCNRGRLPDSAGREVKPEDYLPSHSGSSGSGSPVAGPG